jgi:hypothetical protein
MSKLNAMQLFDRVANKSGAVSNNARSTWWNEGRKGFIKDLSLLTSDTSPVLQVVKHPWCPVTLLSHIALTSEDPEVVLTALMNEGPSYSELAKDHNGPTEARYPLNSKRGGGYAGFFKARAGDDVMSVVVEDQEFISFIQKRLTTAGVTDPNQANENEEEEE